jgi:CDP-diacylglycerol--glycerol-3-phosphate 3-phosphatidyltransferase
MDRAPAWMVAVILGREFAVTALRNLAFSRGIAMPASWIGKAKMGSQVVAILALILSRGQVGWLLLLGRTALWAAVITAIASAADYFRRFNRVLNAPRVPTVTAIRGQRRVG